jgi:hypothetical protein
MTLFRFFHVSLEAMGLGVKISITKFEKISIPKFMASLNQGNFGNGLILPGSF